MDLNDYQTDYLFLLMGESPLEASVRARQLGGIEARVGLVCCHYSPGSLRSELEVATRNTKIAVFGRVDLMNLGSRNAEWVKQNG